MPGSSSGLGDSLGRFAAIPRNERYLLWITIGITVLWRLYMWSIRPGSQLDDEVGHFIVARDAWHFPELVFSFWGRTGCTLFFMPGAAFGFDGARAVAFIASCLTTWLTAAIAYRLGCVRLWLVVLLLELQPWYFQSSHEILTQIPAMICLTAGLFCALHNRWLFASLFIGYLPLCRHELIVLPGLWILVVAGCSLRRLPANAVATALPVIVVNLACYVLYDVLPFAGYLRKHTDFYGSGTWTHFVEQLASPEHVGLPIGVLALVGVYFALRSPARTLVTIAAPLLFLLNTVIYRYGLFASGGFGIFLLPVAPLFAVLAYFVVEHWLPDLSDRAGPHLWRRVRYISVVAWLLFVVGYAYDSHRRLDYNSEQLALRTVAEYVQREGLQNRRIVSTHVWFYRWLPLTTPHESGAWLRALWSRNYLAELRPKDLVVWDNHYSERWGYRLDDFRRKPATWKPLFLVPGDDEPISVLFEMQDPADLPRTSPE